MKPVLSVVIPSYNRVEKLKECLLRLEEQSLEKSFYEIWVVDDGSTDETPQFLKEWKNPSKGRHVLLQKNQGQGIARNKAMEHVLGEIVLFMGDDIYASPTFLEAHHHFHKKNPQKNRACLGLTEWDPQHTITPFMEWMTNGGYQFDYGSLKDGEITDFWHFYTSNLSIKTALLKKNGFSTAFKGYGWEDIELAYRLEKNEDLKLVYSSEALAHHDHLLEEKDLERKMQSLVKNGKIFEKLHPKIKVLPTGPKRLAFQMLGSSLVIQILKIVRLIFPKTAQKKIWYALSKRYFLRALQLLE